MTALLKFLACNRAWLGGLLTVIGGWARVVYPEGTQGHKWAELLLALGTFLAGTGLFNSDRAIHAARQWQERRHDRRRSRP